MYPIYRFELKFAVPVYAPDWNDSWFEGLPEGLQWDRTSSYKMFREELTEKELKREMDIFLYRFSSKRNVTGDIEKSIELARYEEWVCTWFSHYTFDNGQSDEEILDSFQEYIYRIQKHNRTSENMISLMGAEDRWRWSGTTDGTPDTRTYPPCRCEHCKNRGVISINH